MSDQFFQRGAGGEAAWAAQQAAGTFGQEYVEAQLRELEQRGASERSVAEQAQQIAGEAYESTRPASAPSYSSPSTSTPPALASAPTPTSYTQGVLTYDSGSATPVGHTWESSPPPEPKRHGDRFIFGMWALGFLIAGITCYFIGGTLDLYAPNHGTGAGAIFVLVSFLFIFLAMCAGIMSLWAD